MHITSKLPPKQTTLEFLTSSHFKIGKEPKWLCNKDPLAYKSTTKQDYPPKIKGKSGFVKIPPSAVMMHKDNAICDQCSVTHSEFVKKDNVERNKPCQSLNKTNFKMDKDDRIKTFETTQASCYQSSNHKTIDVATVLKNNLKSYIAQGDPEKEEWPESEHKSMFYARGLVERCKPFQNIHRKTIQGDDRCHDKNNIFNTTSMKTFPPYQCFPKLKISDEVKYPKSRVQICGEETLPLITTQTCSFKWRAPSDSLFNQEKILGKLRKTNLIHGDRRYDKFQTTNQYYLTPKVPSDTHKKNTHREKRGLWTDAAHAPTCTTMLSSTRSHYKPPPKVYRNEILDGSGYHTASVICFGKDKPVYCTTTQESFQPKYAKYKKSDVSTCLSSIPFDYYDDLISDTSYRLDYLHERPINKPGVNCNAVMNLMTSHIGEPIKGLHEFNTTNGDTFTRKQLTRAQCIDVGRLQKSNVPIGTIYN